MVKLSDLNIRVFADGANLEYILAAATNPFFIQGFTTNPSLMAKEGVANYENFIKTIAEVTELPISAEVFADDFTEMERQAREIASWGENIYVKVPITDTMGNSSFKVVESLSNDGIKLNITAVFTPEQVMAVERVINPQTPTVVSVFAGRIADSGVDPRPIMSEASWILDELPLCELLWASCREIYNIFQAADCGCHIITVPDNILKKISLIGMDLETYSRKTVIEFYNDAKSAGYSL